MKTIKLKYTDFWDHFDPKNNFITNALSKKYHIEFSDTPDYLIFSIFGYEHLKFQNCIKILYSGENITPDFNLCDYAIGFDHITFGDRYMRLPLYVSYDIERLAKPKAIDPEKVLNRKFCSFVVSNGVSPERNRFFKLLSEYKRVDSGGRFMNNIGGPVPDKEAFIKDYKFNIAFENSIYDGYTTEKLLEPMLMDSLPIYWGNKLVGLDFNPQSFINTTDFPSLEAVVEYVVKLDTNDEDYLSKLSIPWLNKNNYLNWESQFYDFFDNIFNKPKSEARYLTDYGRVRIYRQRLNLFSTIDVIKRKLDDLRNRFR